MDPTPMSPVACYPVFLECAENTSDIFWQQIFRNLAYKITPHRCYISKSKNILIICDRGDQNIIKYNLNFTNTPKVLFEEIKGLFEKHLGLESVNELLNKICHRPKKAACLTGVMEKYKQKCLIDAFCIEKSKQFGLSKSKRIRLINRIQLAQVLKLIHFLDGHKSSSGPGKMVEDIFTFTNGSFESHFNMSHGMGYTKYMNKGTTLERLWKKYK